MGMAYFANPTLNDDIDRYDRTLAQIVADGTDVAGQMIEGGLARTCKNAVVASLGVSRNKVRSRANWHGHSGAAPDNDRTISSGGIGAWRNQGWAPMA